MNIQQLVVDNGLLEKWESGKYILALEVEGDGPCDAIVCPGHGLNNERIKFKQIGIKGEIPDDKIMLVHMIPATIWESMKTTNSLNKDI